MNEMIEKVRQLSSEKKIVGVLVILAVVAFGIKYFNSDPLNGRYVSYQERGSIVLTINGDRGQAVVKANDEDDEDNNRTVGVKVHRDKQEIEFIEDGESHMSDYTVKDGDLEIDGYNTFIKE